MVSKGEGYEGDRPAARGVAQEGRGEEAAASLCEALHHAWLRRAVNRRGACVVMRKGEIWMPCPPLAQNVVFWVVVIGIRVSMRLRLLDLRLVDFGSEQAGCSMSIIGIIYFAW